MCSRIRMSSIRYCGKSFVPVHQFDFQSWMTPTRIPRTRAPSAPPERCGRGCGRARAAPCVRRRAPTSPRRALPASGEPRRSLLHLRLLVARVTAERAGRRELTELVADHLLRDEDGHVLAAVVAGDRMTDHLGEDRRRTGPGADHPLLVHVVHRLDAAHQPLLDERSFLRRPGHLALLLAAPAAPDDQLVGFLVLLARALAERRHAPWSDGVPAALRLALAAAVRVVDGVHRRAAH